MGCDIYFYVERRALPNHRDWSAMIKAIMDNPDDIARLSAYSDWKEENPKVVSSIPRPWEFYNWVGPWNKLTQEQKEQFDWVAYMAFDVDRNYRLFSVLAGVRNKTFPVIVPPRGIPDDVTEGTLEEYCIEKDNPNTAQYLRNKWSHVVRGRVSSPGWHTPSWLLLSEILVYDWDKPKEFSGVVDSRQYLEFKKNGRPDSWCISTSALEISNKEMEQFIKGKREKDLPFHSGPATKITWSWTAREACPQFCTKTIPALKKLGPAEDVRVVFWFDN